VAARHLTHYKNPIAGFVLCYAVDDWESLADLPLLWLHEMDHYNFHKTPYIVCGCKRDIREDQQAQKGSRQRLPLLVGLEEGRFFAQEVLARGFYETSTRKPKEMQHMFEEVFKLGLVDFEKRVNTWVEQKEGGVVEPVEGEQPKQQASSGFWGFSLW
jgi:GTPase SAR1 family protein